VRPMTARLVQQHRTTREGLALADPLAMAVVLEDDYATKTRAASVHVETNRGPSRGLTHAATPRDPQRVNAQIVETVDRTAFLALLGQTFARDCHL
jgi:inosine-uridine nucleoside N-ribohydrolase